MWVTTPSVRRSLMPEYGQSQPYMRPNQALEGAVSLMSPESAEPAVAESALLKLDGLQHNSSDRAASNAEAESAGQQNIRHAAVMSGQHQSHSSLELCNFQAASDHRGSCDNT